MKVNVTEDCICCGLCESICPEVFKVNDVISEVVGNPDNCIAQVEDAAASCPVNAIQVE